MRLIVNAHVVDHLEVRRLSQDTAPRRMPDRVRDAMGTSLEDCVGWKLS